MTVIKNAEGENLSIFEFLKISKISNSWLFIYAIIIHSEIQTVAELVKYKAIGILR